MKEKQKPASEQPVATPERRYQTFEDLDDVFGDPAPPTASTLQRFNASTDEK